MKKFFLLLLYLIGLFIVRVPAQSTLVLKGLVKDATNAEPLIGATVSVKGSKQGTTTNFEGVFMLKTTEKPPFVLIVSYLGYISKEVNVDNPAKSIDIKLKPNTRELKEVAIKDSRISMRQKQSPITVETMDGMAIKETPAANFYEGLAHLKGVDMTSASIGFKIINTRGFNSTSPVRSLQLIDGVDNQSPGLNFSLGNFLGASELDVQKVDLIVGASSAYYGPNAFNGAINMQSKSPFQFPGLSFQMKIGERQLTETALRYAEVFKRENGTSRFAYKLNLFAMSANDWEATNMDATSQSPVNSMNPGGYDAVNRYGDEYSYRGFKQTGLQFLGYGYALRKGYEEQDLVKYKTTNIKLNGSLHYLSPKQVEYIFASSFSTGTTVYQGDNRFCLKDIGFFQNRLEIRKENKFYVRAYATNENAGNSYDAYNTGLLLQNAAKPNKDWSKDYADNWNTFAYNRIQGIRPPIGTQPPGVVYEDWANWFMYNYHYDSLMLYHQIVRSYTDSNASAITGGYPRFEPGTERFDSAFNSITSLSNRKGGSKFIDHSALYHVMGEYRFQAFTLDFITGASFRLYAPNSEGTIFLDTVPSQRIQNREHGIFLGIERTFVNDLKITTTFRTDKNENFQRLYSYAITGVKTINRNHIIRASATSAIRNPTLTDQYINLNVGPATLLGNLNGFDSLVTVNSFLSAINSVPVPDRSKLEYFIWLR